VSGQNNPPGIDQSCVCENVNECSQVTKWTTCTWDQFCNDQTPDGGASNGPDHTNWFNTYTCTNCIDANGYNHVGSSVRAGQDMANLGGAPASSKCTCTPGHISLDNCATSVGEVGTCDCRRCVSTDCVDGSASSYGYSSGTADSVNTRCVTPGTVNGGSAGKTCQYDFGFQCVDGSAACHCQMDRTVVPTDTTGKYIDMSNSAAADH
jgi:hypothetical protein